MAEWVGRVHIFMSAPVPFAYCIHTCQERINNPRKFISLNRQNEAGPSPSTMTRQIKSGKLFALFPFHETHSRLAGSLSVRPRDLDKNLVWAKGIIIPCIMCANRRRSWSGTEFHLHDGEFFNGTIKVYETLRGSSVFCFLREFRCWRASLRPCKH